MNEDTIQDIINYVHEKEKLAWEGKQLVGNLEPKPVNHYGPATVAMLLGVIATRLERLVANQPPTSSLPDSETPSSESNADSFGKILAVKWLGIEFRRFRSNAETVYVATWRNDETRDSHVYEIYVKRDGDTPNCGWIAQATNDGRRVFSLSAKNRSHCELCALSAMKRYLSRGHRGPYRKRMAEAATKEVA